jgi:cytosine/adenosine deaminase-related metal-dependent hydrolase
MLVATHLAESPEELEFVERGTGPIRSLLEGIGLWHDGLLEAVGRGLSPVGLALDAIDGAVLAVHVNHASDEDLAALASAGASVAYCPRASAYFGAERSFGPHRYRDMIAAGINVALGTDSIINLWDERGDPGRLSVLDDMRLLWKRDGARPDALLAMGTVNGARALGLDPERFRFIAGRPVAGVLAVPMDAGRSAPLEAAFRSGGAPRWLAGVGAPLG